MAWLLDRAVEKPQEEETALHSVEPERGQLLRDPGWLLALRGLASPPLAPRLSGLAVCASVWRWRRVVVFG